MYPCYTVQIFIHYKTYKSKKGEGYMSEGQLDHFLSILNSWKQELMEEVTKRVRNNENLGG